MSLGDRLGFAGLFVALIGIALVYLWPTKKWIGWFCMVAAIVLISAWARLEFRHEIMSSSQPQPSPKSVTPIPRSYLTFDGKFRFPLIPVQGQVVTERNFQVGDEFQINIFVKQEGPNPIEMVEASHVIYVESDHEAQTQDSLAADFEERIRKGRKLLPLKKGPLATLTVGEHRFYTAFAPTVANTRRLVTQKDLDQMRSGEEILFVIVKIIYRDQGQTHYLRRCEWLQPPALLPDVWHMCDGFNHSD